MFCMNYSANVCRGEMKFCSEFFQLRKRFLRCLLESMLIIKCVSLRVVVEIFHKQLLINNYSERTQSYKCSIIQKKSFENNVCFRQQNTKSFHSRQQTSQSSSTEVTGAASRCHCDVTKRHKERFNVNIENIRGCAKQTQSSCCDVTLRVTGTRGKTK